MARINGYDPNWKRRIFEKQERERIKQFGILEVEEKREKAMSDIIGGESRIYI